MTRVADSSELWKKLTELGIDPAALRATPPKPVIVPQKGVVLNLSDFSDTELAVMALGVGLELARRATADPGDDT